MSSYSHPGITVTVQNESVRVRATNGALHDWATRPGDAWPCSGLAKLPDGLDASFDPNGLTDLADGYGIEGQAYAEYGTAELNAFTSDAIAFALSPEHPCYRITVGQFVRHGA